MSTHAEGAVGQRTSIEVAYAPQPDSCSATTQLLNHRISVKEQRKGHSESERFGVPHSLATQYLRTNRANLVGLEDGQAEAFVHQLQADLAIVARCHAATAAIIGELDRN
jgi:hypothetical protein